MCLVCFHFEAFQFHRLTEQSQNGNRCKCYGKEEKYCIMFDALKVLIIAPIESKNDFVEATFYKSCLKQLLNVLHLTVISIAMLWQ